MAYNMFVSQQKKNDARTLLTMKWKRSWRDWIAVSKSPLAKMARMAAAACWISRFEMVALAQTASKGVSSAVKMRGSEQRREKPEKSERSGITQRAKQNKKCSGPLPQPTDCQLHLECNATREVPATSRGAHCCRPFPLLSSPYASASCEKHNIQYDR